MRWHDERRSSETVMKADRPLSFLQNPASLGVAAIVMSVLMYLARTWIVQDGRLTMPLPFEDAAMLYRYAENFAAGHGIVWNIGEAPGRSDGATDLLLVVLLAPFIVVGIPVHLAGILVNCAGLFALGASIGVVNRHIRGLAPARMALLVLAVSGPPAWNFVAGGFSAPVQGAILAWLTVGVLIGATRSTSAIETSKPSRLGTPWVVGGLAGLAGWWRPEGFGLAVFVIVASLYVVSRRPPLGDSAPPVRIDGGWVTRVAAVLTVIALGFVAFRIMYFGHAFPTAGSNKVLSDAAVLDLVESGGKEIADSLRYYLSLLLIPVGALALTMRRPPTSRSLAQVAGLIALFSVFWAPFNLTFNHWGRVNWPLVPVILLLAAVILAEEGGRSSGELTVPRHRLMGALAVTAVLMNQALVVIPRVGSYFEAPFHSATFRSLRPLETSMLRVATTEAGLIPLAVKDGLVLDTWVHNTRSIAEQGTAALPSELEGFVPNVIVVHGRTPTEFLADDACRGPFGIEWGEQVDILYAYAERNGLELVLSEGTGECDTWNIFLAEEVPTEVRRAVLDLPSFGVRLLP